MAIKPSDIDFSKTYTYDLANPAIPASEQGNTVNIPVGFKTNWVYDKNLRLTFTGQDGKPKTQDATTVFNKPEELTDAAAQVPDIPIPAGFAAYVQKHFKGYSAWWETMYAALQFNPGDKVHVVQELWIDAVSGYNGPAKIYASDPTAWWGRIQVLQGAQEVHPSGVTPDASYYDGKDKPFGKWVTLESVFDVTSPDGVVTYVLENLFMYGLQNSGVFILPPVFTLVSTGSTGNTGSTTPPTTLGGSTLNGLLTKLAADAGAAGQIAADVANLKALIGL